MNLSHTQKVDGLIDIHCPRASAHDKRMNLKRRNLHSLCYASRALLQLDHTRERSTQQSWEDILQNWNRLR
jgi:hypothetical protein